MGVVIAAGLLFPTVQGGDLTGRQMVLPRDFEGEVNIVLVAFRREQQFLIVSGIPAIQPLETKYLRFTFTSCLSSAPASTS